jgi:hypothetical protein
MIRHTLGMKDMIVAASQANIQVRAATLHA